MNFKQKLYDSMCNFVFQDLIKNKKIQNEKLLKEKFQKVINNAERIADTENNGIGLIDFVKLLGNQTQAQFLSQVAYLKYREDSNWLESHKDMFDIFKVITSDGKTINDLMIKSNGIRKLELKTDLILPCTWNTSSLCDAISYLGAKKGKEWTEDSNHKVEYWLPFGLGWVHGGNHSIMAGIILGEGVIQNYTCKDISPIYEYIYTDGINYYNSTDNTIIDTVRNFDLACIFEIGRIMHKRGISATS